MLCMSQIKWYREFFQHFRKRSESISHSKNFKTGVQTTENRSANNWVKAMEPPAIEDSFEKLDEYPSVVERYYSQYHVVPEKLPADEIHSILVHSNKICLVTLSESHPVVRNKKTITKIDFKVSEKWDRSQSKVVGKSKKGAQFLLPHSQLCFIECSDESRYTVFSCMKGKLIEINQQLLNNPQLLVDKPLSHGFIAIVLPGLKDFDEQKMKLELVRPCASQKIEGDDID